MKVWVVTINGEADFASDKYHEAASRYYFLLSVGYENVELKQESAE